MFTNLIEIFPPIYKLINKYFKSDWIFGTKYCIKKKQIKVYNNSKKTKKISKKLRMVSFPIYSQVQSSVELYLILQDICSGEQ